MNPVSTLVLAGLAHIDIEIAHLRPTAHQTAPLARLPIVGAALLGVGEGDDANMIVAIALAEGGWEILFSQPLPVVVACAIHLGIDWNDMTIPPRTIPKVARIEVGQTDDSYLGSSGDGRSVWYGRFVVYRLDDLPTFMEPLTREDAYRPSGREIGDAQRARIRELMTFWPHRFKVDQPPGEWHPNHY